MLGNVWVLIPAAGVGKRMQSDVPKQYLRINDKTIIEHTLQCFINHPEVAGIIIALGSDDPYWKNLKIDYQTKPVYTVEGGEERSDSVLQTVDYLLSVEQASDDTWVMVHDAARPCLSKDDIDALLKVRETESIGGILACPVQDTMKRVEQADACNVIKKTVNRNNLWHALTPQLFRAGVLKNALNTCLDKSITVTDEASALEAVGEKPAIVEGSRFNIKITRPEDLEFAQWILNRIH